MNPTRCPICGSTRLEVNYDEARDYLTGHVFQIWRCQACEVAFTIPQPENLDPYYPARYRRYNPLTLAMLKLLYRLRTRSWHRAFSQPGKVLELGLGDGFMLDTLRGLGWDAFGSERTSQMAAYARHELGLPVYAGGLEALAPDAGFDLIILFQVLEHLPDPLSVLQQCAGLLKPGGRLVINVPNLASWQSRFGGPSWFHLDVPRHLFHYSPASLTSALRQAGMQVHGITHVSPEHDPYGWIQTTHNWLGFSHNGLTKALMGIRQFDLEVAGLLALAGLMALPALLLALLSWASGWGAVMQVTAVRPTSTLGTTPDAAS